MAILTQLRAWHAFPVPELLFQLTKPVPERNCHFLRSPASLRASPTGRRVDESIFQVCHRIQWVAACKVNRLGTVAIIRMQPVPACTNAETYASSVRSVSLFLGSSTNHISWKSTCRNKVREHQQKTWPQQVNKEKLPCRASRTTVNRAVLSISPACQPVRDINCDNVLR